jgi:hypothetical protein
MCDVHKGRLNKLLQYPVPPHLSHAALLWRFRNLRIQCRAIRGRSDVSEEHIHSIFKDGE